MILCGCAPLLRYNLTPLSTGQDILTLAVAAFSSPLPLVWGQALSYLLLLYVHQVTWVTRYNKASHTGTAWVQLPPEWDSGFDVLSMRCGLARCGKSGIVFQEWRRVFQGSVHGSCATTNEFIASKVASFNRVDFGVATIQHFAWCVTAFGSMSVLFYFKKKAFFFLN